MSDNIFNYFSSKGTRKVDPIDDAEFDSIDAPKPGDPQSQPAIEASTPDSDQLAAPADGPTTSASGHELRHDSPQSKVTSPAEPAPKKSQSHWDYLASLLGIKKESSPEVATQETATAVASQQQEKQKFSPPRVKTKPTSVSPIELAPEEPVKEEVILNSLFLADSATDELTSRDAKAVDRSDDSDEDSDLEYVEFEVEDLDKTEEDDTRKSRRSFSRSGEGRSRDEPDRPRGDRGRQPNRNADNPRSSLAEPHSRERQSRAPQEHQKRDQKNREPQSREPQSREPQSREPQSRDSQSRDSQSRDSQSRDRQGRDSQVPDRPARDDGRRDRTERDNARRTPAADTPVVDRSFGSGIFDEPREKSEARFDENAPRRKRRRRRGRDSSSKESAPSSLPRHSPLPEVDPPDEFFDEVGWQPTQRHNRPETSDLAHEDEFEASLDSDLEFPAADESEQASGERTVRKRRRRRPRGRRESGELDASSTADSQFENRSSPSRERLDDDQDELDYDQAHRNPRQHRPSEVSVRGGDRKLDDEVRTSDEHPKKDRKFPTWEEAISVLVESNIKNHSRSSGQNRSGGNRGRRRR